MLSSIHFGRFNLVIKKADFISTKLWINRTHVTQRNLCQCASNQSTNDSDKSLILGTNIGHAVSIKISSCRAGVGRSLVVQ